jgi:hypothetical protein
VVGNDVHTVNGDIRLLEGSIVEGDVVIENKWGDIGPGTVEIEIAGGSVVKGDVINEDEDRPVRLRLLDGSRVEGRLRGVEVAEEVAQR